MLAFPIFIPGTLTANVAFRFSAPIGLQLVGVSAACANATSFILDVGTVADEDAYLDGKTVTGAAATTTDFARFDFVGGEYPHILANTEVVVTVDYDGGDGNDAAAVSMVLWFTEG